MPIVNPRAASLWRGFLLGAGWTLVFAAFAGLVQVVTDLPNPIYRSFEWLGRVLPGAVITIAIDSIVTLVRALGIGSTASAAKVVEKVLAVVLALTAGGVLGVACALVMRRGRGVKRLGLAVGVASGVFYIAFIARGLDLDPPMLVTTLLAFAAWGWTIGASVDAASVRGELSPERRHMLVLIGVAAGAASAVAVGVTRLLTRRHGAGPKIEPSIEHEAALTSGQAASPSVDTLAARIAAVPGTRPELTSNADFYRVDINLAPPSVDASTWRLAIDGLVERPMELTLEQLRARPAVSQVITLECISNPVGGDLIGTSRWTGIRLAELLDELGVRRGAQALTFEAADGFYESASLDDARDPRALLVYAMNGEPLPEAHGFPLRLYLPNRHGMKLPKWITRIEVAAEPRTGYWVERGWSAQAIPHTTSVIDTVRASGEGARRTMSIGGIAYAGARGIRKVEVQIDGGPWQTAQLRTPALSQLTWVQWRLDVPYREGRHTFRVRATDGTGALQETTVRPPHPDGATGLQAKKAQV